MIATHPNRHSIYFGQYSTHVCLSFEVDMSIRDELHKSGALETASFLTTMIPNSESSLMVNCSTIEEEEEEDEDSVKLAVITPPSCNFEEATPEARDAEAAEKWVHNCCVFRDNPSIMTSRMLI